MSPYISQKRRKEIEKYNLVGVVPGELNYNITKLILQYLEGKESYSKYNEIIGVLECCKLELYSRQVRPYEDDKIRLNGDVFNSCPTERNLAWAAGFFEGEGCFYAAHNKPRLDGSKIYRTHASLSQKGIELLEQFKNIVGFGVVYKDGEVHIWKTTRVGEASKILEWLRPWLSRRRIERAEELLGKENLQVFRPLSKTCSKGHEFTPENTIEHEGRSGRICRNEYARLWRSTQPEGYWRKYEKD